MRTPTPLPPPITISRRRFLQMGLAGAAGVGLTANWADLSAFAADLHDFIRGPIPQQLVFGGTRVQPR